MYAQILCCQPNQPLKTVPTRISPQLMVDKVVARSRHLMHNVCAGTWRSILLQSSTLCWHLREQRLRHIDPAQVYINSSLHASYRLKNPFSCKLSARKQTSIFSHKNFTNKLAQAIAKMPSSPTQTPAQILACYHCKVQTSTTQSDPCFSCKYHPFQPCNYPNCGPAAPKHNPVQSTRPRGFVIDMFSF